MSDGKVHKPHCIQHRIDDDGWNEMTARAYRATFGKEPCWCDVPETTDAEMEAFLDSLTPKKSKKGKKK